MRNKRFVPWFLFGLILLAGVAYYVNVALWKSDSWLVRLFESMAPADREAISRLTAPVVLDIDKLPIDEPRVVTYRGTPVLVLRTSPKLIASLSNSSSYSLNQSAAPVPDTPVIVLKGLSPNLGCVLEHIPPIEAGWAGGFRDPCHNLAYDYAGRALTPGPHNPYKTGVAKFSDIETVPHAIIDGGSRIRVGQPSAH